MFVLVDVEEVLGLPPQELRDIRAGAATLLERRLVERVLPGVGLVVRVHELLEIGEGVVAQGEGAVQVKIRARLCCFRPFEGEIIEGTITSCDGSGVHVTLGFFDTVLVSPDALPQPVTAHQGAWVWAYEGSHFWLESGARVRCRVRAVKYGRSAHEAPMWIEGDMAAPGLGPIAWWD